MGIDKAKMGEGFTASKGGGAAPPPGDRQKTLKQKMALGLGITAVGVAAAVYGFFGVFFPAYKEYQQLVGEKLQFTTQVEQLAPKKMRLSGNLGLMVVRADGVIQDLGTLHNLIVNAGENFMVDAFQNTTELENLRFHGIGLGTTAAAETDTGCQTELTTQYNPDSTRATGSLTEGASANIFRTVGTNTVDAAVAITEFCLMSQAATGGGTMWSRVVFSAINLASGDSLQTTYDLTVE